MLIESIIKREGGTRVDLDRKQYHFKPKQVDGVGPGDELPHVCEVEDEKHITTFLAISEGFREFGKVPEELEEVVDGIVDDIQLDPEAMSNDELNRWATKMGINPSSKVSIFDYAFNSYGEELDKRLSPANMIREIVKLDLEEVEEEAVDADE